jgi:hypothetical protein
VICKVLKGKPTHTAFLKNGIKSRRVTDWSGHNIKIDQILRLEHIGSDEELLRMAQAMPTVVRAKNVRLASKQNLTAHLQLVRLADQVYTALTESFTFNLSLEVVTVYNLC